MTLTVFDKFRIEFGNKTDSEIIELLSSKAYYIRLSNIYGDLDNNGINKLLYCIRYLLSRQSIKKEWYDYLYVLSKYAEFEELDMALEHYIKGGVFGNTLGEYIVKYGKTEGAFRHQKLISNQSLKSKGNNYQNVEVLMKKYNATEEEIIKMKKESRKKAWETIRAKCLDDPRYFKKRSILSVEYYLAKGYTDMNEIESLRTIEIKKIIKTREAYVTKYGEELGNKKYDTYIQNNLAARKRHILSNEQINRGKHGVSKQSIKFFDLLLELLKYRGITFDNTDICYGKDGYCNEKIIHDGKGNVYFIDFYIRSVKIAIEYDGVAYHCIDVNNWPEKSGLLTKSNEYYYYRDVSKKETIQANSNLFITVRSDNIQIEKVADLIEKYIKGECIDTIN